MYTENPNCIEQTQKKYTTRPSPPFPANECCGEVKMGNDGKGYISLGNKNGVCRWVLLNMDKKKAVSPKKQVVASPKKQVVASPKKVIFDKPIVKLASPKKSSKLSLETCMALKVVELKEILSTAKVVGRSKLTNKDLMCKEIVKLGL